MIAMISVVLGIVVDKQIIHIVHLLVRFSSFFENALLSIFIIDCAAGAFLNFSSL
jgi:hypothetical protein